MGRSPCCIKEGLKKGPWTQEEDHKLLAFVTEHGHGTWRSLPKRCGLLRCGKSCRLRWTNYLRPDIKRGLFTKSEEHTIIRLHSLVGNKWAFIASQLPKRTDNELKNYWNTVLKKRIDKARLLSLGTARPHSSLSTIHTPAAERQQLRQGTNREMKSSGSTKPSSSNAISSPACTHLAQWESARLEAEARLSKHSQSSQSTHKLLSFSYLGHTFSTSNTTCPISASSSAFSSFPISTATTPSAFSSLSQNIHTNPQSLQQLSNFLLNSPHEFPSNISNPCLIQSHPPTINYLSTDSSLSLLPMNFLSNTSKLNLPAIVSMPSSCSASNTSFTSSNTVSSQESIASALSVVPSGRMSWQAKGLSITPSPNISSTSQSSFISQMLCQIDRHHGHEVDLNASTKGDLEPAELKGIRGNEQMSLEATSSMLDLNSAILENSMDLNSTIILDNSMDLNSTMDNWHDFIFDVENSCVDNMVSTNWKESLVLSSPREEFTHDATSNSIKTCTVECPNAAPQVPNMEQDNYGILNLEGFNLIHFDSIMSCDLDNGSKELLWDTPTTLSVSSAPIVN